MWVREAEYKAHLSLTARQAPAHRSFTFLLRIYIWLYSAFRAHFRYRSSSISCESESSLSFLFPWISDLVLLRMQRDPKTRIELCSSPPISTFAFLMVVLRGMKHVPKKNMVKRLIICCLTMAASQKRKMSFLTLETTVRRANVHFFLRQVFGLSTTRPLAPGCSCVSIHRDGISDFSRMWKPPSTSPRGVSNPHCTISAQKSTVRATPSGVSSQLSLNLTVTES